MACNKNIEQLPELRSDAGPAFDNIENDGYYVTLSAASLKDGQSGEWFIITGEHGNFSDSVANNSEFYGEPGQVYVLQWIVEDAEGQDVSSTSVSFKAMQPEIYIHEQETADNMYLQLYGNEPEFEPATCVWRIVSGENGQINNATSHDDAALWGEPGETYVIEYAHLCGVGADESVEYEITLGEFKADAGNDSTYVPSTSSSSDSKYITLWAALPHGASGQWRIIVGDNARLYNDTLPTSVFQGTPDVDYSLEWTVSYHDYVEKDTVTFSISDKWALYTDPFDGNQYRTVELNGLEWFVDNYNRTTFLDGAEDDNWYYGLYAGATINDGGPVDTDEERQYYGRLYTLDAAQRQAPDGWRLPTADEFNAMINDFGGIEYAGSKLREGGISGLELTFGGYFSTPYVAFSPSFAELGAVGTYWVDTEITEETTFVDHFEVYAEAVDEEGNVIPDSNEGINLSPVSPNYALSVRYVRDIK